jgi:Icc-related predicted phosphoesterase
MARARARTDRRVARVLCAADPRGSTSAIEALGRVAAERDVQAIAIVGELGAEGDRADSYRAVFRALGETGLPAYWVPGASDAPVVEYLREAYNIEVVYPFLRGVHGTGAYAPDGHVVFAGLGGHISDDPDHEREEQSRLSYPRWEPEYRLKLVRELEEHQLVLLFATPPMHKGRGVPGSEVLTELIATERPRLVVCGGPRTTELIGRTNVVAPGSLADGHYAFAELYGHEVELAELAPAA